MMAEDTMPTHTERDTGIVEFPALKRITGLKRRADVRRRLEEQGIACFSGKDGPWTTHELIKVAGMAKMGLIEKKDGGSKEWL